MKFDIIKNERDYEAIAKRIEELVDADPLTPGAWELKKHVCAIIAYEQNKMRANTRSKKSAKAED